MNHRIGALWVLVVLGIFSWGGIFSIAGCSDDLKSVKIKPKPGYRPSSSIVEQGIDDPYVFPGSFVDLRGGDYQFCIDVIQPSGQPSPTEVVEVVISGTYTGDGDPTWVEMWSWILAYTWDLNRFAPPENVRFMPPTSDETHRLWVDVWEDGGVAWVAGWLHDGADPPPVPNGQKVPLFRAEHRTLNYGPAWFAIESEECLVPYQIRRPREKRNAFGGGDIR